MPPIHFRNEYLVIENRILRSKVKGRLRLKNEERRQLAEIGKKLGRKALETIATIANILKKHGLPPAEDRKKETSWRELIDTHMNVLVATDFFTTEAWSRFGLVTHYVLFFIHLGARTVHVGGVTPNPDQRWIAQIIRNITDVDAAEYREGPVECRERIGGLLKFYYRQAAQRRTCCDQFISTIEYHHAVFSERCFSTSFPDAILNPRRCPSVRGDSKAKNRGRGWTRRYVGKAD